MTGLLKATLAHQLADLAAVHVGKTDIQQHQVHMFVFGMLHAVEAGARDVDLEFLVQG